MPAQSPSDDPQLPQLRRFRFGPGDAVPREVTPLHSAAGATPLGDDPGVPPRVDDRGAPAPGDDPAALPDDRLTGLPDDDGLTGLPDDDGLAALLDDDGLAALLDGPTRDLAGTPAGAEHSHRRQHPGEPAGIGVPSLSDPAALLSEVGRRPRVPASGPPTVRRGAAPPARPVSSPPTAAPSAPAPRRARLPLILTCAAAIAVLALIGWLVLRPADGGTEAAGGSRAASAVSAGKWADGACQALASFENAAMPLRALAVQAAAESGTPSADVGNLRREAETLLENLAARVTAIGSPAPSSPVAALQDGLSDAVQAAIGQTGGNANGSVGGPGAAASLVSQALAAPLAAFKESLEGLDAAARQEVTAIESCAALL